MLPEGITKRNNVPDVKKMVYISIKLSFYGVLKVLKHHEKHIKWKNFSIQ